MADLSPESRAILEREYAAHKVLPGEGIAEYIRRMHGNNPKGCTCPTAYSRCRYAVHYDYQQGIFTQGHGGWGWPQWHGVDDQ